MPLSSRMVSVNTMSSRISPSVAVPLTFMCLGRKWLDKDTGEIFSYDWDLSEFDETRLNAEFVAFLKEGD